ncbi:MAG: exopolysaccharide biosynthesis polyprenyl glycosylphosphotransferase [Actinomycetota bacterium]
MAERRTPPAMPAPPEPELDEGELPRGEIAPGTEWLVTRAGRQLNWLWQRGFRFLFVLDAVGLLVLMVAISIARFGFAWPTYPLSHYAVGFSIAAVIHLTVGYFAGLYEREPRLGSRPWLPRVTVATLMAIGFDGLMAILLNRFLMPRFSLAVFGIAAALLLAANRRLSRYLARRREGPPRVVLIGSPDDIATARSHLADSDREAVVVATAPGPDALADLVAETRASDVLLLDGQGLDRVFPEPLTTLERSGVGLLQRVGAQETMLGLQSVREVAGLPFVKLRAHTLPSHKVRLKRNLELVFLAALAPAIAPVVAVTAAYVRIVAGSDVLYRQERVGRDGEAFEILKFRTMVRDAEAMTGVVKAEKDDPRVVRGCRWLRATRLDELPQLWNVVRGQMSLVGPRPERPELAASYAQIIPGYERRHELPPGLTGLAQVQGGYDTDPEYKLGHDLQYLVNWSPVLDVQIVLRTAWVVLARRG